MYGNIYCRAPQRLAEAVRPGDTVRGALDTGHNSGFIGDAEVRAVHHWGVYAKVTPESLRSYNDEYREKYRKMNFKMKWRNIYEIHLK